MGNLKANGHFFGIPLHLTTDYAKIKGSKLHFLGGDSVHRHYGHMLRHLHSCVDQNITAALASMDLTAAQGAVMGFIIHSSQPPCARDVEQAFQLSHPTVSGLLSRLEKKGFLEFRPDETDRRCKRIYILPKGMELNETMHRTIQSVEERMVMGFGEEEKELFRQYLQRAIQNMGADSCKCRHKEETET
jgi:DNA-binding MarR family transcriptional regulator